MLLDFDDVLQLLFQLLEGGDVKIALQQRRENAVNFVSIGQQGPHRIDDIAAMTIHEQFLVFPVVTGNMAVSDFLRWQLPQKNARARSHDSRY